TNNTLAAVSSTVAGAEVPLAFSSNEIDADTILIYEPPASSKQSSCSPSYVIATDGGAGGGLLSLSVPQLENVEDEGFGRTKFASILYDFKTSDNKQVDLVVTISNQDNVFRAIPILPDGEFGEDVTARRIVLKDETERFCTYSSLKTGERVVFQITKSALVQNVLYAREDGKVDLGRIASFPFSEPIEACVADAERGLLWLGSKSGKLFSFNAEIDESQKPLLFADFQDKITGLTIYKSSETAGFLFVALGNKIAVVDRQSPTQITQSAEFFIIGVADTNSIFISQLNSPCSNKLSSSTEEASNDGWLALAKEDAAEVEGYALVRLSDIAAKTSLTFNATNYTARSSVCKTCKAPACPLLNNCSLQGRCSVEKNSCRCFSGFKGETCAEVECSAVNNCSGNGQCSGPNQCQCFQGWTGDSCSTLSLTPKYETEARSGIDGDDPAIWVHKKTRSGSRVITTTKSAEGAGLQVFDLKGRWLQYFPMGEPNNVDVLYDFEMGGQQVDLVVAGCRADSTLCLARVSSTGILRELPNGGGRLVLEPNFEPYGSCELRSKKTGRQYIFVNSKTGEYLQYHLTSTSNSTLRHRLVRRFTLGDGAQPEGCVGDPETGDLFAGEEPVGLWKVESVDNETIPASELNQTLVDSTKQGGNLVADVEGVSIYAGPAGQGYLLVSCQGISAFNVYDRKPPHAFITRFAVEGVAGGLVDSVTATDGLAVVSTRLNRDFEEGLIVVHDDINQNPNGTVNEFASFKYISWKDVAGNALLAQPLNSFPQFDPRS
ncbi:hypothetical protein HDV05_006871, partial [Chytridiales sp. JEL 0842]